MPKYDSNKARSEERKGKPIKPVNVKQDWRGQTKEQLRALPDIFSTEIRNLPQAYVVPPQQKNHRERVSKSELKAKRKASEISSADTPATAAPMSRPSGLPIFPPAPELPARDVNHGNCVKSIYSRLDNT